MASFIQTQDSTADSFEDDDRRDLVVLHLDLFVRYVHQYFLVPAKLGSMSDSDDHKLGLVTVN